MELYGSWTIKGKTQKGIWKNNKLINEKIKVDNNQLYDKQVFEKVGRSFVKRRNLKKN